MHIELLEHSLHVMAHGVRADAQLTRQRSVARGVAMLGSTANGASTATSADASRENVPGAKRLTRIT